MSGSKLVDLDVTVLAETDGAYGIENANDPDGPLIWLPKSQCEIDAGTLTCPEWIAQERGLI